MQQLKSEFEKNGGTFREWKLSDLFTLERGVRLVKSNRIEGRIPLATAGEQNQGIAEFISNSEMTIYKDKITIDMFCNCFYRDYEFMCDDNILVLFPMFEQTDLIALYITTIINKDKIGFHYGRQYRQKTFAEHSIFLPTTAEGKLAFDYMESYIRELEEERIRELEEERIRELSAYLTVSGLEDYTLTQEEESAICLLQNNLVPMCEFKIGELITGQTGDVDLQQKDINGKGCYFINSGVQDFGIKGKTDKVAHTFKENTITIDFWGNAYYRDFEYKLATHNHVFSYTGEAIKNKEVGLYLCATMTYFRNMFSYSNMGTMPKIADLKITLPITNDGSIDYDFMQTYISAIQKKCIKNVVLWKDKQLSATKKVVSLSTNSK